jgi:hypothetical protein
MLETSELLAYRTYVEAFALIGPASSPSAS